MESCKIIDFGFARHYNNKPISTDIVGTAIYSAPEIVIKGFHKIPYNPFLTDIYSLGICIYTMSQEQYPFDRGIFTGIETIKNMGAESRQQYINRYKVRDFKYSKILSHRLESIINRLLEHNEKMRPDIIEVDRLLNDNNNNNNNSNNNN